jgi:iron complex outermembrane receptor protein
VRVFSFIAVSLLGVSILSADDKTVKEINDSYEKSFEELLNTQTQPKAEVGSRSGLRDALDAEVPLEIITQAQLESSGYTQLGRVLSKLIAGYNQPRPSIADGTDHTPPFTLRGLAPDQVLVLINGKRVHQSSLLNINGTIGRGSSGVDIDAIPLRAIERIEVLRDGAAAQYGSDAIAGVINIILKGYGHQSTVSAMAGETKKKDGKTKEVDIFYSHPLQGDGFVNFTAELVDRDSTNRANADAKDNNRVNTHFGDPDASDVLMALNMEIPKDDLTLYAHAALNKRESEAGAFFRRKGDSRNVASIYPEGFLPLIHPTIVNTTATAGVTLTASTITIFMSKTL